MREHPDTGEDAVAGEDAVEAEGPVAAVGGAGLLYRSAALLLLLGLVLLYFQAIARVLLLGFVAVILAVALNKLVEWVPLRRSIAAPLGALVLVAGFAAAIYFLGSAVARQLHLFLQQIPELWETAQRWEASLRAETGLDLTVVGERAVEVVRELPGVLRQAIGLLEVVALMLLVVVGAFFVASEPNDRLLTPLMRAVPRRYRPAWYRLFHLLGDRLGAWLWGSLVSMLIIGSLSTIAFYIVGAPYPLLLGVTIGLLEAIPLVGPWIGGSIAVIVTLLHDPGLALWVALVVIAIQQLEGNLIHPVVMRGAVAVHPFVTLLALILFSSMFGVLGAVLSLPLVLALQTAVQVFWIEEQLGSQDDPIEPVVRDD